MNITPRFVTAIKISFTIGIILSIYSFATSYFELSHLNTSDSQENSVLNLLIYFSRSLIGIISFWALIGYLSKDYKAAIIAALIAVALNVLRYYYRDVFYGSEQTLNFKFYFLALSGIIPFLAFGFAHFRSAEALKLIICWAVGWASIAVIDFYEFEQIIKRLGSIIGLENTFEVRIATGENSYRVVNIFSEFLSQILFIIQLSIFWWLYNLIKTKTSIWEGMKTCYNSAPLDRFSFSIIFWSFRLFLFIAGIGFFYTLQGSVQMPFDSLNTIRIIIAAFVLIIITAVYRNFLMSYFAHRNKYPGGIYFFLNVPIINIFVWLKTLFEFNRLPREENINDLAPQQMIRKLQIKFKKQKRNNNWKWVIIVMTVVGFGLQFRRIAFRYGGQNVNESSLVLIIGLVAIILLLWFFYDKTAYVPILILNLLSITCIVVFFRNSPSIQSVKVTGLINIILLYGMFYFDELKWFNEDDEIVE